MTAFYLYREIIHFTLADSVITTVSCTHSSNYAIAWNSHFIFDFKFHLNWTNQFQLASTEKTARLARTAVMMTCNPQLDSISTKHKRLNPAIIMSQGRKAPHPTITPLDTVQAIVWEITVPPPPAILSTAVQSKNHDATIMLRVTKPSRKENAGTTGILNVMVILVAPTNQPAAPFMPWAHLLFAQTKLPARNEHPTWKYLERLLLGLIRI
jgi:hypothetical protein